MNILKPYIGIKSYISPISIEIEYEKRIKQLNDEKQKLMFEEFMNLFNNFRFKRNMINRYKEDISSLCCDIFMINNIKQSYEKWKDTCELDIGREYYEGAEYENQYKVGYTKSFDCVKHHIEEIHEDIDSNNCFSDMCTFGLFLPEGNFYNFVLSEFEYADEYYGQYNYTVPTFFYPVFLEIEKVINSNSEEFIKLIKEYQE